MFTRELAQNVYIEAQLGSDAAVHHLKNGMLQSNKENELRIQTNGGISKTEGH